MTGMEECAMGRWPETVDEFASDLLRREASSFSAELIPGCAPPPLYEGVEPAGRGVFVKLRRSGHRAFFVWFCAGRGEGLPLLVYSPGYEATLRNPPEDLRERFNVLFLSPLGYGTPEGPDDTLRKHGAWPVLFDTVLGVGEGYDEWLLDALCAIRWAGEESRADMGRLIFAGCSQGGGMSLVLGSLLRERTAAVCADQPFLVDFSGSRLHDVIAFSVTDPYTIVRSSEAERRLRCCDPLCHARRLTMPVLVCSGELDRQCPACFNEQLFRALPSGERNRYVCFPGRDHGYSVLFYRELLNFLEEQGF